MKDGVKRFHEQDTEVKKQFYTRDSSKPVVYDSNFDLYSAPSANWRDTLSELLSDANRPKYRETTVRDFIAAFQGKGLGGTSALANFKI
ncbi:hypothetical protein FNV43_RR01161 [Rhamnella rubrinervis]|uniref:Uncharacterized protein n=1 Tax=Rhamnella rubrinervis TaxID=2594499 RepID=A0A8K0HS29_9ROSA|nr:hypothetical protein FNV43_RR01161 [Rhamnella rubrinervis]